MVQISFAIFLVFFSLFAGIMVVEPRSLWSVISFFVLTLALGGFLLSVIIFCYFWLSGHSWVMFLLVCLAGLAALLVLAFPLLLLAVFAIQGIKVVRHEGLSPSNLLSLAFAGLWFGFLFIWPAVGVWEKGSLGTAVYSIVSFSAVYMLSLMAMYALSAILNLIHLRKSRRLDYIVVLGSGIDGTKITPLLAARVDKGIQLLRKNPEAKLILSGGQGPGEEIPESEAMAAYALERGIEPERLVLERQSANTEENLGFSRALMEPGRPRVAVVTTAYHVFRALLLAKRMGLRCVGFGAKTKWYFTLNAVIREFAGYIKLTRRRHIQIIGVFGGLVMLIWALTNLT